MNKLLMGAVGLSVVLASCGGVGVDDSQGPRSEFQLAANVTDVNTGTVLAKGTYVICDNTGTDVELDVNWVAGTQTINFLAVGEYYGQGKFLDSYAVDPTTGGSGTLVFTIDANTAPLNVKPQSIVVTPVYNVDVKGYTRLGAQAVNTQGVSGDIQLSSYVFPVVDCS